MRSNAPGLRQAEPVEAPHCPVRARARHVRMPPSPAPPHPPHTHPPTHTASLHLLGLKRLMAGGAGGERGGFGGGDGLAMGAFCSQGGGAGESGRETGGVEQADQRLPCAHPAACMRPRSQAGRHLSVWRHPRRLL